ncbi:MAG: sigma-70 family RNA polymerase sigma factor [Deltaproteobacteria bacterium]|nr:sigma-70 family RNA polymerase sigma factor [Deltaproteobacteria bacterium]
MNAAYTITDSLHSYLAEINRFPVLSKDEEHRLALRWHEKRDLDAAHRLVTSNLRFVVKIALEYKNYGAGLKDLIQEGNIGLMTAVKKFNPYRGYRLITYAAWWIKSMIQDYILRTKGIVKRPANALKRRLFYKNILPENPKENTPPIPASLALAEAIIGANDVSLDASISPTGNNNDEKTQLEMLASADPSVDERLIEAEEYSMVKRDVNTAMTLLSERERLVIEKRVLSDNPESLQTVGDGLGITRERVRQIESSALRKLKNALSPHPA